jgi:hypothetical protein
MSGMNWFEAKRAKYIYTSTSEIDTIYYYNNDLISGWIYNGYILHTYSFGKLQSILNATDEPSKHIYQYTELGILIHLFFKHHLKLTSDVTPILTTVIIKS